MSAHQTGKHVQPMNREESGQGMGLRILILCCLGMIANAMSIQVLSPVSHSVQEALSIDYSRLGFLMGSISIPGIIIAFPGGFIADRWGARRVIIAGFIFMILGALLFAMKPGYTYLCLSRIATGVGCILSSVLLPGILTPWFREKRLGTAMGIFNMALPLGSIFTLSTFGALGALIGPFRIFYIPAAIALLSLVLFILFLPEAAAGDPREQSGDEGAYSGRASIAFLGLIVLFANMSTMGYVTIAPSYFEISGYPVALIGIMLSAVLWGALLLSPLAGYLTTHHQMAKTLIFGGCLFQGAALALIPRISTPLAAVLVILAVSSGLIMTPVYILVPKAMPQGKLNRGYGIIMALMMVGCLTGPSLAGFSVDRLGGFNAGFLALGIFSVFGALCALPLPRALYRAL